MNRFPSPGRRPGALRLVVVLLAVGLVATGGWLMIKHAGKPAFSPAGTLPPVTLATTPPPPTGSAGATPQISDSPAPSPITALVDRSFVPTRFSMSRPNVSAPVQPVQVEPDGTLEIPENPDVVGWWSGGAAPGSPVGTVVIAGHVDTAQAGPGALFHLSTVPIGTKITVAGDGQTQTYEVQARRRYLKQELPWQTLFEQTLTPRLVIVTCGGAFDSHTRHYTDNVVVVAVPT